MKIFIVALLLAIGYAQTVTIPEEIEGNPWTCRHTLQKKFHISDFNGDESGLNTCLENIYKRDVPPNKDERVCDKGSCTFKECCWDKFKTIGDVECADPNPNAEVTDVHSRHEGCVFKCEKTQYGPFIYDKEWKNDVELTVAKYEVKKGKSTFEARMEWKGVGSQKDANGNLITTGLNVDCDLTTTTDVKSCSKDEVKTNKLQVDVTEWDCGICDEEEFSTMHQACCENCGSMIRNEGWNSDKSPRFVICKNCPQDSPFATKLSDIQDSMRSYVQRTVVDMQVAGLQPQILSKSPKSFKGYLLFEMFEGSVRTQTKNNTCNVQLSSLFAEEDQITTVTWGGCETCEDEKKEDCCRECSEARKTDGFLVCHGCKKNQLKNGQGHLDVAVKEIVKHFTGKLRSSSPSFHLALLTSLIVLVFL